MHEGRSWLSRMGEEGAWTFPGSKPWVLEGSADLWPLNGRHASTQAWGREKPSFPTSNAIHQHDTMSFLVRKIPQDRHDEPLSGKQPTNKKGEVTGSCWSRRT